VPLVVACACQHEIAAENFYQRAILELRQGNLSAAQTMADNGIKQWGNKSQSPWHWKYHLLQAEIFLTRGNNAKQALALLTAEPPNLPDLRMLVCRWKVVRAKALRALRRTSEARTALGAAESLAAATNERAVIAEINIVRGNIFADLSQPSDAEAAYKVAIHQAREVGDTYLEALSLNNLGLMRFRQLRCDEALPLLTGAKAGFEKMGAKLRVAGTLTNIGLCSRYLGDFDKASAALRQAVEVQEREGVRELQGTLAEIGNLYIYENDVAKAIPYYQRAFTLATEMGDMSTASKWAGNLALAFSEVKNWDEAEKFNQQSEELKQKISDVESQVYTQLNAANIAKGRRQTILAENLYTKLIGDAPKNVLWEAHAGLAQLYRETGNKKKSYQHFDAAINIIEASRAELSADDYKITFFSRLINFYQRYVDALVDDKAFDRALEVAESSRARVLAERFDRGLELRRSPSAETYARRSRQSGTTFLAYWLAPVRSFLWVITPKTRKLFVLPPKSEIEDLARSYQEVVDRSSRDPLESVPPAARRLSDILLTPARDLVASGSNVVIVPDGALHNMNFETLPITTEKPHYWIEDATVAVAPSLAVNLGTTLPQSPKSLLIIGNPVSASAEYAPLPYAGAEVRTVAHRLAKLQQAVYEGSSAEPSVYRTSNPGKYSIVHFAAHAFANRESPLESAIILSSSGDSFKLYARDVLNTPLQADLVTISACRSAGARVYSGEGLVGFAWAFLLAGAKNVIAGLWDVNDSSTAQLMDHLYEQIDAGKSPVRALREAKLALIHSQSNFRKPYYWGPFQVYVGSDRH